MTTVAQIAAHMPHNGWDGGPGWFVIFPILWFLLIATAIFFLVRAARRGMRHGPPPWVRQGGGPNPVAILGERYARGEIDESEYRSRLDVLRTSTPPSSETS